MTVSQHRCYVDYVNVYKEVQTIVLDENDLVTEYSNAKPSLLFYVLEDHYDLEIFSCKGPGYYSIFQFPPSQHFINIFTFSVETGAFEMFCSDDYASFVPLKNEDNKTVGEYVFNLEETCKSTREITTEPISIKPTLEVSTEQPFKTINKSPGNYIYIAVGIGLFLLGIMTFLVIDVIRRKSTSNQTEPGFTDGNAHRRDDDENSGIYDEISVNFASNYDMIQDENMDQNDAYQHPECRENTQNSYLALNKAGTTRGLSDAGYLPMGFGRAQAPIATQNEDEYVPMRHNDGLYKLIT